MNQETSEVEDIPESIELLLWSKRSLLSAFCASKLGYLVLYVDATGNRVNAFRQEIFEGSQLLHTTMVRTVSFTNPTDVSGILRHSAAKACFLDQLLDGEVQTNSTL